ncbi:uncharacterized protein [Cicer arietinum]|uniref:Uncharacterized protein DDB_G0281497 n=1 Tax=Cicer arietinum TaxID=3827 RepID=A0A1S2YZG3_CICAR|nr:uncharacterized protein DDB_G0281497 [Cicer arietinum]
MVGGLSDPSDTDDSTIDEIINQAQDAILLQQISAINCSSFSHSDLPTHLECRFQKLKSFPANHTTPPPYLSKARTFSNPPKTPNFSPSKHNNSANNTDSDTGFVSSPSNSSHGKKGLKPKSKEKYSDSTNPHYPINSNHQKSFNFSPSKDNNSIKNPDSDTGYDSSPSNSSQKKKGLKPKPKPKNGSVSDSSHSSEESSMSSLFMPLPMKKDEEKCSELKKSPSPNSSPPRKWGCFWCSPKKKEKKKSKENGVGWEMEYTSDELLSGVGSLSSKKRLEMIDKALKMEEQKINREAEKIVEWAKHVSARMNVSDIEDEFSDD